MVKGGTVAGTVLERCRENDGATPSRLQAAGYDVLLVSERSAAWLPTSPHRTVERMFDDAAVWSDEGGTRWTPDLVHCRLVEAGSILKRLPTPPVPSDHATVWRMLAPAACAAARPSAAEIGLCEWTLDQLMSLDVTDRVIAIGFALSIGARLISDHMKAGYLRVRPLKKSQICDRYKLIQAALAESWNAAAVTIDRYTYERWLERMKAIKNRTGQTGQI